MNTLTTNIFAKLIYRVITTDRPSATEYILDDNHDYRAIYRAMELVSGVQLGDEIPLPSSISICYHCGSITTHDKPMLAAFVPSCPDCYDTFLNRYDDNQRLYWPSLIEQLPVEVQRNIFDTVHQLLLDKDSVPCYTNPHGSEINTSNKQVREDTNGAAS